MWMSHPTIPGQVVTVVDSAFYSVWQPKGWVESAAPPTEVIDIGEYISRAELVQAIASLGPGGGNTVPSLEAMGFVRIQDGGTQPALGSGIWWARPVTP